MGRAWRDGVGGTSNLSVVYTQETQLDNLISEKSRKEAKARVVVLTLTHRGNQDARSKKKKKREIEGGWAPEFSPRNFALKKKGPKRRGPRTQKKVLFFPGGAHQWQKGGTKNAPRGVCCTLCRRSFKQKNEKKETTSGGYKCVTRSTEAEKKQLNELKNQPGTPEDWEL